MQKPNKPLKKQKGAALILMAFIIGLAVTAYLLHALDPQRVRIAQEKKTVESLNAAKQALIAWSVSHPFHPGQMPFPDRGTGGGYDGKSDCNPPNNNPLQYSFLIGQLPIYGQTNPCVSPQTGIGGNFQDAQGNRLWYAVSRNLTRKYETNPLNANPVDPIINPSVIDNPMYAWMKVLDRNGALVSDRVAAVIIAPGDPIGRQSRSVVAPPSEFLDTFKIGENAYSNADYTKADEDFIIGEDSRNVSSADTTFVQPYNFNDKLVYITIDELIAALNNRAAAEASNLLNSYKAKTGQFPFAANLGAVSNNNISSPSNQQGSLPIDVTDTCSCRSYQSCGCSFKPIISVTFTLDSSSGTWKNPATLLCTRTTSKKCTCTGAGRCDSTIGNYFECDNSGNCDTDKTGSNKFTFIIPSYVGIPALSGACTLVSGNVDCNDLGAFDLGLKQNSWFKDNLWQDYFYYEWSSASNLQVGSKTGIKALLVATGRTIVSAPFATKGSPQIRPSNNIADYLDSPENTDGNLIFDATNKQKTSNYNDQAYIVAP